MNILVVVFLIIILLVAAALFVTMALTKKSGRTMDVAKYQSRWMSIESSLKNGEPATYPLSILNADKLVDAALRDRGMAGQTMSERMKAAQNIWSNADHVWGAHKIRNRIAHEPDAEVTYEIAARSLAAYKQALKDLGAV